MRKQPKIDPESKKKFVGVLASTGGPLDRDELTIDQIEEPVVYLASPTSIKSKKRQNRSKVLNKTEQVCGLKRRPRLIDPDMLREPTSRSVKDESPNQNR